MTVLRWIKDRLDLFEMNFWILCAIPTLLWWKESILWVCFMSLYANAKTAHGAWKSEQAKRETMKLNDNL